MRGEEASHSCMRALTYKHGGRQMSACSLTESAARDESREAVSAAADTAATATTDTANSVSPSLLWHIIMSECVAVCLSVCVCG